MLIIPSSILTISSLFRMLLHQTQTSDLCSGCLVAFELNSSDPDYLLGLSARRSFDDNSISAEEQSTLPLPPTTAQEAPRHVIMRIPNTAFGIPMALAGNAILWKAVGQSPTFRTEGEETEGFGTVLWLMSLLVAIAVGICYCYKCCYHHELVAQEWKDRERIHFMNLPHVTMIMLAMGLPDRFMDASQTAMQIVFGLGLLCQTMITQVVYDRWLFSPNNNISFSKPPCLLSTFGWFVLASLGIGIDIEATWGLPIPQFCLGIGSMFYLLDVISIMHGLHASRQLKGAPSLALLLAPPAVGLVAVDALDGDSTKFSTAASMVLGWILLLFLLFAKIGPVFLREPGVLGEYWAYVSPLNCVATAWVRYTTVVDNTTATVVAAFFMGIAIIALFSVIARMIVHCIQCSRGQTEWGDPLLMRPSNLEHRIVTGQLATSGNVV